MDFNSIKLEIKKWSQILKEIENTNFTFKEEVNFQNIQTLSIEMENKNNLGIIIIYQDNHLYFDFMSKNDTEMNSYNWSGVYSDLDDLKVKIEKSLNKYW